MKSATTTVWATIPEALKVRSMPAHMSNSTWGWDSGSDHFIPNFSPEKSGEDACLEGQCVPPFHGMFRMGNDAMASGRAMYDDQRYTLHTPYSMYYIQKNLESKAVFDESSATGFRKWNDQTESMEEYIHKIDTLEVTTVAPLDGNAEKIAMLFGHYDKVQLNTRNGYWAKDISLPAASSANKGKVFVFESEASYTSNLSVNGESVKIVRGSKHTYVSNGQIWVKDGTYTANKAIKPKAFGVPVTTLVGYYDPQKTLPTYIYQPLHGAFGYTYADDADTLNASDCALEVVKGKGDVLKFRLKNNRQNASAMNKFHVNIARADQPKSASVVCNGTVLDTMAITDPQKDPMFTVQGVPLGGVAPAQRIAAPKVPRVAATRYEPEQCAEDHDHCAH